MYNSSSVCAVSFQARALCSQKAISDRHRFIVGTCSLHDSNEISVLQYLEDANHFESVALYSHPDQVWAMEASPTDPSLIVTSRQANNSHSKSLTLWKMPFQTAEAIDADVGLESSNDRLELSEIASFNQTHKPSLVYNIKWHKSKDQLLTVDSNVLSKWDIGEGKVSQTGAMMLENPNNWCGGSVAWDPHSSHNSAVVVGTTLQLVDTRGDMEVTSQQTKAHDDTIRDVDYNPNKPLMVITAGNDRKLKFWDIRNMKVPVRTLEGHSHWLWSAKYNPCHDQLVLSGGSDNMVNLWRVASCSSAPWLGSDDTTTTEEDPDPADVKVRSVDSHEDAVYSVVWSAADAWIHCSLSFDGRVILNHVPSTEKYKILL